MRASRNPPSVFTIFRYAAYLNKVQRLLFDLAFLRVGQIFHSVTGNLRLYTITVRQVGFFSVLLPIISDYPSPDHTCCMEGGVSSAVAVIVHRLALDTRTKISYFSIKKNSSNHVSRILDIPKNSLQIRQDLQVEIYSTIQSSR